MRNARRITRLFPATKKVGKELWELVKGVNTKLLRGIWEGLFEELSLELWRIIRRRKFRQREQHVQRPEVGKACVARGIEMRLTKVDGAESAFI